MKVALVNPRLSTWDLEVHIPLGLTYIAAVLENARYNVKIIDLNVCNLRDKEFLNAIDGCDVVGITGMVVVYNEIIRLSLLIKERKPKIKIVLGGALVTTRTETVMINSNADYAVIGEGERTILSLLSALNIDGNISGVKGIAYNSREGIKITQKAEQIEDISTIPYPARHLLDLNRYSSDHFRDYGKKYNKIKSAAMFSSRGCPYSCNFCFHEVWGHKWRGRSPDNIMGEMKLLYEQYGYNGFVFYDDTFVLDKDRVIEFCNKLIESKMDVIWGCNGRVNLMDEELIKIMSKAGCKSIGYGIESGNPEILKFIQKGITLEQVEKITKLTEQAGIHVTGLFMIGMLGETKETIRQTIDFARKLNLSLSCFAITVPMYGTKLYELAQDKGLVSPDSLEGFRAYANTNLTLDCTREELEKFSKDAYREFTLEKRYGKDYLLNPLMWIDGVMSLKSLMKRGAGRELINRAVEIIRN